MPESLWIHIAEPGSMFQLTSRVIGRLWSRARYFL